MKVNLGDEVRDRITGFTGIATGRHTYLTGCSRISVQPPMKKGKGKLDSICAFDEPMLEVIKAGKVAMPHETEQEKRHGGPNRYMPEGKTEG